MSLSDVRSSSPPTHRVAGIEWFANDSLAEVFAMQGNRAHMEDRFSVLSVPEKNLYLYGVFDGHGGEVDKQFADFPALDHLILCSYHQSYLTHQSIEQLYLDRPKNVFLPESESGRFSHHSRRIAHAKSNLRGVASVA